MSDAIADSLYYFRFQATTSADAWVGFTYADTGTYAKGQTWAPQTVNGAQNGYYTITDEVRYDHDLSYWHGSQYDEGATYVYSYYDAETNLNYVPAGYQQGSMSGRSLGMEYDSIYVNGTWDPFNWADLANHAMGADLRRDILNEPGGSMGTALWDVLG